MLTYILGAGASYQSIPIVNTFPKRFKQFVKELEIFINSNLYEPAVIKNNFTMANFYGKQLADFFESHQSFDTYFKKLFHTNEIRKIKLYKKILNLYFIWEHLKEEGPTTGNTDGLINTEDIYKKSKVDTRYDALIAGLLQPIAGEKKMFCKTNFITWNYDLNLLSSIKNYFYPNTTYKIFLEEIGYQNHVWQIRDQISVINMNGFFYSNVFDDKVDIYNLGAFELIKNRMVDNYFDDDYIAEDAELIKFAWETDNTNSKPKFAKELIASSDNVVIIGYTFPLYNRLIDTVFLNRQTINSTIKLFIQDPNANDLMSEFINAFEMNTTYLKRDSKINCNQFFVPNDIIKEV